MMRPPGDGTTDPKTTVLVVVILALSVLVSWRGADVAREREEPRDRARALLDRASEVGDDAPEILEELRRMRSEVGRRPLDSMSRVVYAVVLASRARSLEDLEAPAYHARRAAQLAPVTVPVVNRSVYVALQTGRTDEALALIRDMFSFDAKAASSLLSRIGGTGLQGFARKAIPDDPEAWLAWYRELRATGNRETADGWLEEAIRRWPDDLAWVQAAVSRAWELRDWERLSELTEVDGLVERSGDPRIVAGRARARVAFDRPDEARADAARALELGSDSAVVLLWVGDVYETLGDTERARQTWSRALWRVSSRSDDRFRQLLYIRIARLEDEQGRADAALRAWRSVLELDPTHDEARNRVYELTGRMPDLPREP